MTPQERERLTAFVDAYAKGQYPGIPILRWWPHGPDVASLLAEVDRLTGELAAMTAAHEAAIRERNEARGVQSAYESITQAITLVVGDGQPCGPYWEDGVRWLQRRAEAAEARIRELEAQLASRVIR